MRPGGAGLAARGPAGLGGDRAARVGGQDDELAVSFRSLTLALGLAIFMVYVVMAMQFESLVHPFVILLAVQVMALGVYFERKVSALIQDRIEHRRDREQGQIARELASRGLVRSPRFFVWYARLAGTASPAFVGGPEEAPCPTASRTS